MKAPYRYQVAFGLLVAAVCLGAAAEPDEDLLGKALGYPIGSAPGNWYSNPYRVGSWSALDMVRGLQMSSGLTFTERYDGQDDVARLSRAGADVRSAGKPIDVLRSVSERSCQPMGAQDDAFWRGVLQSLGGNVSAP